MKRLFKYFKEYKKECILAPCFKLLEACFDLIVPLIIAAIIDNGINGGEGRGYILRMCLILVLTAAVGLAFAVTAQYFAAKAAVGFSKKVRSALFRKIEYMTYAQIDKANTTTLIGRMTSDVNQVTNGVNLTLRLLLRAPIIVFGSAVMALIIDVKSAIVFLCAIPVLFSAIFIIMYVNIPLYKKTRVSMDGLLGKTRENISGVRVIRAFTREDAELEEFDKLNKSFTKLQTFAGKISAMLNPLTYVIINAAVILIIYVGSRQVQSGVILQGSVVALYNYMSQILVELIKLASLIIAITKSLACAGRISDVLYLPEEASRTDIKSKNDDAYIEFDHCALSYQGGDEALSDISFKVDKGDTIGIIGGTGSGKSSLVNLIPRLYDATSGAVYVDGEDVRKYDKNALRDKIGIVPQEAVLFSGTVRDNMKWGKADASDDEIYEALSIAQIDGIIREKGGLDINVSQGGRNFSGGQRQRLVIARALVKKPEILILDDSSSALDYATDAHLRASLKNIDATVFIVSQRASSIMQADKIIVLDDGCIAGIGKHTVLFKSSEVYREIYCSQFEVSEDDTDEE